MYNFKDLTGRRYGRLTVICRAENTKHGSAQWLCQCDCGNKKIVRSASLNGNTKSCGCLYKDTREGLGRSRRKYECGSNHRLYHIWQGMKYRCINKNGRRYKDYGGRGITVCDEWKNNFQSFYEWSVANGYREDLSIDRIDNDKGYCPENCRWATALEQRKNRRDTVTNHNEPAYYVGN